MALLWVSMTQIRQIIYHEGVEKGTPSPWPTLYIGVPKATAESFLGGSRLVISPFLVHIISDLLFMLVTAPLGYAELL